MSVRHRKDPAPSTLLEAARLDVKGEFAMDIPATLHMEGFEDDMSRKPPKAPTSPTSPLTKTVVKSSMGQPKVAIVRRLRLRTYDENDEAARRTITRRHSTPESPGGCRRSNSLPPRPLDRPMSANAVAAFADHPEIMPTLEAPKVRDLSSQEMAQKNQEAVDWFKKSRRINRKIRSIEDTEALLAKARERRDSGAVVVTRRKSQDIPLDDDKKDTEEVVEQQAPVPGERRRSVVDPALLWGLKPRPPKPEMRPEIKAALNLETKKSCMRGNVQCGATGENGLLARLKRRSTHE